MHRILRRIMRKGSFLRNVATLTGATAFSQLVVLAALPLLTRLYTPGEYGAAAVYAGIVGLIVVVATFRYELAIPLPRSNRAALHVATVALIALVAIIAASGVAASLMYSWLGQETGLSGWAFSVLVVVGVATAGCYQVVNYWAVRKSKFGAIARTRIQQGVAGTTSQLALGLAGFGTVGLIVGQIIGQGAGCARLATGMIADNRVSSGRVRRRGLAWAAKRYRKFPLYDSWAGLLNIAGSQAPVFLFATLFSPVLAGYYALAYRVLSAPMGLVGKAISQVLMPRIVEAGRRGVAGPLVLRLLGGLAWLSFFPFTVVALTANEVVPLAFGAQWAPAASIMAWTALWIAWQFVVSPMSTSMAGLEALRLHTAVQAILFVLRVGAIVAGAVMSSPEFAVISFTLASVVGYAIYLFAIGYVAGVKPEQIPAALSEPLLLSAAAALAVYVASGLSQMATFAVLSLFVILWLWRLSRIRPK